ncbi:hypothetical protein LCGC14_1369060 [marine sediment metagenome]|uniref:Uncharacterized protein n=1 Tax=marine sediment metagenome TaxID=412755 RepID=A0A0F9KRW0_9ZZZZ
MSTNDFAEFCQTVKDFWPRCKTTERLLQVHWENGICHHPNTVVQAALTKAISEFPDDTAPKWKVIRGYLAARSDRDGSGKSEFQILLDQVRRDMKRPYGVDGRVHKGVDNMTEEDIWLNWVRAQIHCTLYDMQGRKEPDTEPCTTCERTSRGKCGLGRRACLAKRRVDQEYSKWRHYLEDRDEQVPAYLVA